MLCQRKDSNTHTYCEEQSGEWKHLRSTADNNPDNEAKEFKLDMKHKR